MHIAYVQPACDTHHAHLYTCMHTTCMLRLHPACRLHTCSMHVRTRQIRTVHILDARTLDAANFALRLLDAMGRKAFATVPAVSQRWNEQRLDCTLSEPTRAHARERARGSGWAGKRHVVGGQSGGGHGGSHSAFTEVFRVKSTSVCMYQSIAVR